MIENTDQKAAVDDVAAQAASQDMCELLEFRLGDEFYAVRIEQVFVITEMQDVTPVPDMEDYIKGVINLRGAIVPVFDLGTLLGIAKKESDQRNVIMVCEPHGAHASEQERTAKRRTGLIVDVVTGVVKVPLSAFDQSVDIGADADGEYIDTIIQVKDTNQDEHEEERTVLVLDLDALTDKE
jgi:purine-binding chemotaxis protein CheW